MATVTLTNFRLFFFEMGSDAAAFKAPVFAKDLEI